jgi:hypothetical protein
VKYIEAQTSSIFVAVTFSLRGFVIVITKVGHIGLLKDPYQHTLVAECRREALSKVPCPKGHVGSNPT